MILVRETALRFIIMHHAPFLRMCPQCGILLNLTFNLLPHSPLQMGTETCHVNSAVRHSIQFALDRALFKISVPFLVSKDMYKDIL